MNQIDLFPEAQQLRRRDFCVRCGWISWKKMEELPVNRPCLAGLPYQQCQHCGMIRIIYPERKIA